MSRGSLPHQLRDVLGQVATGSQEEGVDHDLGHAVASTGVDGVVERGGYELHVGDVDAKPGSPPLDLLSHPLEMIVRFGPSAPVIHDDKGAAQSSPQ